MTAEIALLNREAVALAADSAVTFRTSAGLKVLPSANKIFTLSKYHPVGVMVYGSAHLMDAPWELLIKSYRRQLGSTRLSHLEDYATDFLNFLSDSRVFFPEEMQLDNVRRVVAAEYEGVRNDALRRIEKIIAEEGSADREAIERAVEDAIDRAYKLLDAMPTPSAQDQDLIEQVCNRNRPLFVEVADKVFEKLPIGDEAREKLAWIAAWSACKLSLAPSEVESGLVVAGYGEGDAYPALRAYRVESVVENSLIYAEFNRHDVAEEGAGVMPFAQSEMVHAFMEGIEPGFQRTIQQSFEELLRQFAEVAVVGSGLKGSKKGEFSGALQLLVTEIANQFQEKAERYRYIKYAAPAVQVTGMLPKDELAAMAESLVNLTAFRRRISFDAETVGGPIDVAVISKGDGFIWIKRKHYFSRDLNPHFTQNYFREDTR